MLRPILRACARISFALAVFSNLLRSTSADFVSIGYLAALSIVSVPFYVRILGVPEWSLVTSCLSLQLLFSVASSGLSQLVPRWTAHASLSKDSFGRCLSSLRQAYGAITGTCFVALQFAANYLSNDWFQNGSNSAELSVTIRIVAFQLSFQLANSLNYGVLVGVGRQNRSAVLNCCFQTLKHVVAILFLYLIAPKAWVYALAFSVVSLVELFFTSHSISKIRVNLLEGNSNEITNPWSMLTSAFTLSIGIALGTLFSQMDRILISRVVDLERFGVYVAASNLANAFLQLAGPLTRFYGPKLALHPAGVAVVRFPIFRSYLVGTTLTCGLPCLLASHYSLELVNIWIRNARFATLAAGPLSTLLVAISINALYNCIYQVIILTLSPKLVLCVNLGAFSASVVLFFAFARKTGIDGAAVMAMGSALTQLVLGGLIVMAASYKQDLQNETIKT